MKGIEELVACITRTKCINIDKKNYDTHTHTHTDANIAKKTISDKLTNQKSIALFTFDVRSPLLTKIPYCRLFTYLSLSLSLSNFTLFLSFLIPFLCLSLSIIVSLSFAISVSLCVSPLFSYLLIYLCLSFYLSFYLSFCLSSSPFSILLLFFYLRLSLTLYLLLSGIVFNIAWLSANNDLPCNRVVFHKIYKTCISPIKMSCLPFSSGIIS